MEEEERTLDASQPAEPGAADLRTKALELLDFPAIRDRVAAHATFLPARELALQLVPAYTGQEVEELQRETAEGTIFLEQAGDIAPHTSEDASPAVERSALEGTLSGLELLAVAGLLEVQRRARSAFLRVRNKVPLLASIAEGIPELDEVLRRIGACIGSRGDVLDSATPVLGDLRRQTRETYQRVTDALERIIQSDVGRKALQDNVVSTRADRLVLQVKTELRQRVPGVVHDASNTGATLFIEPFATVDLCNAWRELALEETRETAWVIRDLSALVGAVEAEIRRGTSLTARLDFILARARYSASLRGVAAERPEFVEDSQVARPAGVRLMRARHPLLGKDAVPVDIRVGPGWSVLVITGPNTGGKTVAMKTLGLLAVMHQSGLRIAADEGSALPVFDGVYADVGDQQSIQGSVSTFGSHMRSVISIISHATSESLVLLDELGTSTDPEEGSALAKSILGHLASRGIATVATTHHRSVAAHAQATPGMMNASVDLDPRSLTPTYQLTTGVPGRSYAMSVAAQMGLPDQIMEEARSLLEPQHLRFEDWLNELQNDRRQLKERLHQADESQAQAEAARHDMETRLEEMALRREDILSGIRREMVEQYEEVRRKLRRAEAALSWSASAGEVKEASTELTSAKKEMDAQDQLAPGEPPRPARRPLAVGDIVAVRGLNLRGTVTSISEEDREAEVAVGDVRFRLDMHRLAPARDQEEVKSEGADVSYDLGPGLATGDLDLRGSRAEDALITVEDFLDKALRDGFTSVRIIHGRGTGALRRAVRELLAHHPMAKSFAPETPERGGDGATLVELV